MADGAAVDAQLVAAYRAGDDAAFDRMYARHHAALLRYAKRVLGKESSQAEDVVQEAMLRASRALRRDDRAMVLRPWLFRLTRNCALDELSRLRTDSVELDLADAAGRLRAARSSEPEEAAERRLAIRTVLGDVALLPEPQRHALLRREVDGVAVAQLAVELDTTEQAVKSLVHRARTNLVKQRDARTTTCADVQRDLLEAHDERRRASAATYRHLASCGDCRAFRSGLKATRHSMAVLSPGPLLLAGGGLAAAVKLFTGAASASTKGVAAKTATTAAVGAVVTAGAVGVGIEVFNHGDPAPQRIESPAVPGKSVRAGQPLPAGTAVVRRTVMLAPGTTRHPDVLLPCPPGLRVADLLPAAGARVSTSYSPETIVGVSDAARVVIERRALTRQQRLRVAVLCKRPDGRGSLLPGRAGRALSAGAALRHVLPRTAYLHASPGGGVIGSVRLGQPVHTAGAPADGWQRIVTDAGRRGWVRVSELG